MNSDDDVRQKTGSTHGMTDDWRESAYLDADNWPEAIPAMGPAREYGPHPWGEPTHDHLLPTDTYPYTHPAAASCGGTYAGHVCPYCGVPLRLSERVVTNDRTRGLLADVTDERDPGPAWHPECFRERLVAFDGQQTLSEVVVRGP